MIEATVHEIRALLQLAELDALEPGPQPHAFRSRREASRRRVTAALLDRYELLLEAGRLPPVVAIERQTCSGCHVRLPTMLEHQLRRSPCVHSCPHCRRMVYAPEHLRERGGGAGAPEPESARRRTAPARDSR